MTKFSHSIEIYELTCDLQHWVASGQINRDAHLHDKLFVHVNAICACKSVPSLLCQAVTLLLLLLLAFGFVSTIFDGFTAFAHCVVKQIRHIINHM